MSDSRSGIQKQLSEIKTILLKEHGDCEWAVLVFGKRGEKFITFTGTATYNTEGYKYLRNIIRPISICSADVLKYDSLYMRQSEKGQL